MPLPASADAFMERFLQSASGAFNIFTIYIGDRLGLSRALNWGRPVNRRRACRAHHTHHRYIREWLDQQSVAGILAVENEREEATNAVTCPQGISSRSSIARA